MHIACQRQEVEKDIANKRIKHKCIVCNPENASFLREEDVRMIAPNLMEARAKLEESANSIKDCPTPDCKGSGTVS